MHRPRRGALSPGAGSATGHVPGKSARTHACNHCAWPGLGPSRARSARVGCALTPTPTAAAPHAAAYAYTYVQSTPIHTGPGKQPVPLTAPTRAMEPGWPGGQGRPQSPAEPARLSICAGRVSIPAPGSSVAAGSHPANSCPGAKCPHWYTPGAPGLGSERGSDPPLPYPGPGLSSGGSSQSASRGPGAARSCC